MDNKELREAYDALTSGQLDTSDIEPYMHTITEALQIAGLKLEYMEQQAMIGKMEFATGVKVRLGMDLPKSDITQYVEDFLREYKEFFRNKRLMIMKDTDD